MRLDKWQEEVIATKGNICLRSGRQVGKSTVIALKAARFALENPNKLIMVIAFTEKQAKLLFSKILFNIVQENKQAIAKPKPTKHIIRLKNKSTIHCYAAGDTGFGIMGFTIDLLIADEAAFIAEEVWNSITPALAITRGKIWLLSTPFLKKGYYYDCFSDSTFTSFHQSHEECPRKDQDFLDHKKKILTKANYAQMYLGEFRDDMNQFYSKVLIELSCTLSRNDGPTLLPSRDYFLGVDVARMGEDLSAFQILEMRPNGKLVHIESLTTAKTLTTDTTQEILNLDKRYNFKKIYIDSTGVGAGVLDQLLTTSQTSRKVIGIENAKKSIDFEEGKKKTMKEDLYDNLLKLMERGEITLLDDDKVKASLASVQFEYNENDKIKIGGEDTHITEALIRAAWCVKDKGLNIWIRWH